MKIIIAKKEKEFIEDAFEMGRDKDELPNNKIVKIKEDSDNYIIDINTQFIFDMVKLAAKYINILKPIGVMLKSINSDLINDCKKLDKKWAEEKKHDAAVEEVLFPGDKIIIYTNVIDDRISNFHINDYLFQVCDSVDQIIYSKIFDCEIKRLPYSKDITEDNLESILKEAKIISKNATIIWDDMSSIVVVK